MNQIAWKDNALVLFLSTVYTASEDEQQDRTRKRPTTTQPRARPIKRMFGSDPVKRVSIPTIGAVYNDKMGAVDIGDQLKESLGTHHRIRKGGWRAIAWNFLLETILVNTYLLQLRNDPLFEKATSQKEWRHRLAIDLLERYSQVSQSRKRLRTGDEFTPKSQHNHVQRGKRGPCLGCEGIKAGEPRKKARRALQPLGGDSLNQQGSRKRGVMTRRGCDVCDVAICTSKNCWDFYHSLI